MVSKPIVFVQSFLLLVTYFFEMRPFSTNYPFSIWIFELRSGVDKFFALKEKNEVSCDILVVWSEVDF